MIPDQKDAWNKVYSSQFRPWKGIMDVDPRLPFRNDDKILDIGCGNGKSSFALINAGYNVTGIDISDAAIGTCRKIHGDKMRCIVASAADIPLDDAEMDGAVMIHVLEHMDPEETERAASEIHRILRPGAKLFVRVFHISDMRSDKGERLDDRTVVRGNGIRYRYFTETELRMVFINFFEASMQHIEQRTKFRETRSRIEAVFEKTE
ncbi:MAG: class I SAM-dependent methyltransferase [Methanomassiliicoccaceae archaeon]|nr:class I SAM-dependent methyltransferase [Methanomassiliicoccaceae archaeon]